jgi:protein-L-isoaspartate(D-aspartate) O-methyltransferase
MGSHLFLARANMVNNQVTPSRVTDQRLIEAMLKTPRELFVPAEYTGVAYSDTQIRIGNGRTLFDPTTFARMAQLAKLEENDLVLDIGSGTGYSTAIFANLVKKVISIEPEEKLASAANYTLNQLGIRNAIIISEMMLDGHPEGGPYNVIFLNGSVTKIPDQLIDQLSDGGRLVAIVKQPGKLGEVMLIERHGSTVTSRMVFEANVSPLNTSQTQSNSFEF